MLNMYKYSQVPYEELAKMIVQAMGYNREDIQLITDELRNSEYRIIKESEPPKKTNFLWRLTFPLFVVWALLLFSSFPVNWLMTGSGKIRFNSPVGKFNNAWYNRLFGKI